VGDVLLVQRGSVRRRCVTLPARVGAAGVRTSTRRAVRLCGRHPITVELEISDGARVEVAARDSWRSALVGPYLAAAMTGLPPAPVPWPKRGDKRC